MAGTQTETESLWEIEARGMGVGALGGLVAGVGMGLCLQFGTDLLTVLGAFTGAATPLRGWLVHLVVSVVYGALFAVLVVFPPIRSFLEPFAPTDYVLAGIVYAVMMAAVSLSILPFVFELPWVTAATNAPFENVPGPGLGGLVPAVVFGIAHLVYGALLGAVYGVVAGSTD